MKRLKTFSLLLILFLPSTLNGQAISLSQDILHPITVMEARHLPDNSWVTLTGNIVNSLPGGRDYTFRDYSGEIIVRIDRRVWRGLFVDVSDIVEISGVIRVRGQQVTINVETISSTYTGPGLPPITINQPITVRETMDLHHV